MYKHIVDSALFDFRFFIVIPTVHGVHITQCIKRVKQFYHESIKRTRVSNLKKELSQEQEKEANLLYQKALQFKT